MNETTKPIVYVDTREKRPAKMMKEFEKIGFDVREKYLESGDIYFPSSSLLVERKTGIDFLNSFRDGRLGAQLKNLSLQKIENKLLLLEGIISRNWFLKGGVLKTFGGWKKPIFIKPSAFNNFILARQKTGILFLNTTNVEDTVHSLAAFAKYLSKDKVYKEAILLPQAKTLREKQLRMICGFEGVGVTQAKLLFKEFKTVDGIIAGLLNDEWSKVHGIGKKTIDKGLKLFSSRLEAKKKKKCKKVKR